MVDAEGFANLTTEAVARLTRSSLRTVRRWRASGLMPRWAFDLLTLLLYRPLGMLADEWDGWHLRTSVIEAPNGYQFTPGELMSIPLRLQEIAALKREIADEKQRQIQSLAVPSAVPLYFPQTPLSSTSAPPGKKPGGPRPESVVMPHATWQTEDLCLSDSQRKRVRARESLLTTD